MYNDFIEDVSAMQVLDSRGNPTIQVKVKLESGAEGISMVPSGASTGSFEACELRDGDMNEYNGLSVNKAVRNVNELIGNEIIGMNVFNQRELDEIMIKLDGTKNKEKLGANAILGTSIAISRAAANSLEIPLYKYLGGINGKVIPMPMMNILNGGKHANNTLSIQEFMIVAIGGKNFKEIMEMSVKVYKKLKEILKSKGLVTAVGDEGGFAPDLEDDEEAIKIIINAIEEAGYKEGEDFKIALDIASTEMYEEAKKIGKDGYYFWKTNKLLSKEEMIEYIIDLVKKYPIISVEDGLAEEDWESWNVLTKEIGKDVQLVGDDLFVTNKERLKRGIEENIANAILIKPNQIGTITETLDTIRLANKNGYKTVISHRSGETEDTFIADLAVAVNAGQIKTGAPCRTDRVCKYNRLLNIENEIN